MQIPVYLLETTKHVSANFSTQTHPPANFTTNQLEAKMKIRYTLAVLAPLFIAGCGTLAYTPSAYSPTQGFSSEMPIRGSVNINNAQPAKSRTIVYSYGPEKLASNYNAITQAMVDEATRLIKKNGVFSNANKEKTINIKVNYLKSVYVDHLIILYWEGELKYTAILGNSETIHKTVHYRSDQVFTDLNGCIKKSVIDLLNNPEVRAYLAK